MKRERRVDLYLLDIITAMDRIASYIQGHTAESFATNFMTVDAVVRNFEIIGEASNMFRLKLRIEMKTCPGKKCTS
jgi:uncharacterized protein with HEPN domain